MYSFLKEVLQEKSTGKHKQKGKKAKTENSNIISGARFHMIPWGNLRELHCWTDSVGTYESMYTRNHDTQGSYRGKCKLIDTSKEKRVPMSERDHSRESKVDAWRKAHLSTKSAISSSVSKEAFFMIGHTLEAKTRPRNNGQLSILSSRFLIVCLETLHTHTYKYIAASHWHHVWSASDNKIHL